MFKVSKQVSKVVAGLIIVVALISLGIYATFHYYSSIECIQLKLTPEECLNLGTHQYHVKGTFTSGNCTFEGASHNISNDDSQKTYESVSTDTIDFQGNALSIINESGKLIDLPRISKNTYARQEQDFSLVYVFNKNGYVLDAKVSPGHGCSTYYEMTMIDIK